jgi:adenylate cyclase
MLEDGAVAEGQKIDFEAEGLLDGVEGKAREGRRELLQALADDGVSLEELRRAVEEDRLALLPVERALAGEYKYTRKEVAEKAGLPIEFLARELRALGLPVPPDDEVALTEEDLEEAKRSKVFLDVGLPEEGILEVARVIGMSMARLSEATQQLIGEVYIQAGDTERDLGFRYAEIEKQLTPALGHTMQYVFAKHLRESVKQAMISNAELEAGELPGSSEIAVSFADLVGFTRLGEGLAAGEIGELSGKLAEIASSIAEPPVRLVKMIGDAAMLVGPDPAALLEATISLVNAVEETEALPSLRAGVAFGDAIGRAGDWYGRSVNLASRITGHARDDSVLVTNEVRDAVGEENGFRFSRAGRRHFKGIAGEIELHRARREEQRGMFSRALSND